ncbi:MAG TPA: radical SAM protein, partial [Candidatus Absconditabacterales bacterium]|nr:radical SAM protein [Candidatus Absconditabacterales bacterium]
LDQQAIKTKRYGYNITNLDTIKYSSSIQEAITINETANNRIIGLTVETRPEFITDENCRFWRELGVTRLEIGVQSLYDDVLEANKRGHSVQQIRQGIHKLRQYGFKFSIHIMPGLYQSDYEKDLGTFEKTYSDLFIKPDEIKFYPTSVIPNTELYDLYISGHYKPLLIEHIQKLIKETFKKIIPPYTRIKRLIRDIPSHEIAAGSNITNLSQLTHNELLEEFRNNPESAKKLYSSLYGNYQLFDSFEEFITFCLKQKNLNLENGNINTYIIGQDPDLETYRKFVCLDTRSREIRHKPKFKNSQEKDSVNLIIRQYESSVGIEYFLSFEDLQGYIYGFTRLLLPKESETIDWEGLGKQTALIRELHIYGQLASLKENIKSSYKKQHKGFGSQIMFIAEQISKSFGYQRLSVISGVGVRGFFKKIGYSLDGTYMVKSL